VKKSELYLLFFTLFIGLSILLVALFKYIKPSNTPIVMEETEQEENFEQSIDNGWIDKISKSSQKFSYPVTIYKLKL
jgi:hypothetical protein